MGVASGVATVEVLIIGTMPPRDATVRRAPRGARVGRRHHRGPERHVIQRPGPPPLLAARRERLDTRARSGAAGARRVE